MRVSRVVMGEVDESALVVPDVLAVDSELVARRDRDALADVDVVVDQQRLRRPTDPHDEALMRARRPGVVGEDAGDRALRGDLDAREVLGVSALYGGVPGDGRATARCERGAEKESAKDYERGAAQCSKALRKRPAPTRSASAITTTIAMRRKSLVTYPRSHAAARSRPCDGAPTAREVPVRDPYRVGRLVPAGRDCCCSRSGAGGRAADARRDASTARRERARTRCFFATGGRG